MYVCIGLLFVVYELFISFTLLYHAANCLTLSFSHSFLYAPLSQPSNHPTLPSMQFSWCSRRSRQLTSRDNADVTKDTRLRRLWTRVSDEGLTRVFSATFLLRWPRGRKRANGDAPISPSPSPPPVSLGLSQGRLIRTVKKRWSLRKSMLRTTKAKAGRQYSGMGCCPVCCWNCLHPFLCSSFSPQSLFL